MESAAQKIRSKNAEPEKVTMSQSHMAELPRLRRVRGQIDGIEKMIVDGRYCIEILQQVKAARSALKALEATILKTHLKGCLRSALTSKNSFDADTKIQEITDLVGR